MRIALLLNPSPHWRARLARIRSRLERFVPDPKRLFWVDRSLPDSLEALLRSALKEKFDRIGILGGDGTLNRAVNFLVRQRALESVELGLVPLGTCNDFARFLGLSPGPTRKALRTLVSGRAASLTIGQVNGVCFVNNCGFGRKNPQGARKGPLRVIREMTPVAAELRWDRGALRSEFYMMLCANAPYFSGGLHFSRRSNPWDPIFEFFFVHRIPKIHLALRLLLGRVRVPMQIPPRTRQILRVQTGELALRCAEPISIVVDGEPRPELGSVREARFQTAGRCRFLVPA